jgi:NADPH-dependent glutamate synthase beta subunit-like oxidoreductase/formate hydrogenlyase subunit 6/NADH:ubiquinone oxidoreductase subunit I
MPSLVDNIKAVVTGMKVTLSNFLKKPVTVEYPWDQDEIPPISRGTLRMVDFHDAASISEKSAWYPGTRWAPCTEGCPAHTDARGYVTLAGEARWREGLETLRRTYPFVGTLGRVCPAPCEKKCSRGFTGPEPIAIRKLKRVFSDWEAALPEADRFDYEKHCCATPLSGKSVGIVGAGPAGYQAAMLLRSWGFEVFLYEARALPGGFLTQGIPVYRLPRPIVHEEMRRIHSLPGIHLQLNTEIGQDLAFDQLEERHDEIIVAAGAWKPYRLGLDLEEKPWVWYGEDFLEHQIRGHLTEVPAKVVVVGGGNTGFDCARTCRRLGAEVTMIYRRTRKEMPSEDEEIEDGEEEGVRILWLTSPQRIVVQDGQMKGLEVLQNRLGAKDRSGRRRPVPIEGSEHLLECGMVITALGREVDLPWLPSDIRTNRNGTLVVDEEGRTTRDGVWACGDVTRVSTIIAAIGAADRVALGIARKHGVSPQSFDFLYPYEKTRTVPLQDGSSPEPSSGVLLRPQGLGMVPHPPDPLVEDRISYHAEPQQKPFRAQGRQNPMPKLPAEERTGTFAEVELGFPLETARQEGQRCYGCSAEMCVGCGVCVDACPDACIYLESKPNAEGFESALTYSIDLSRCCYCGLCTEACPTKSLVMTANFEFSVYDKSQTYLTKDRMNLGLVHSEKAREKIGESALCAPEPEPEPRG